MLSFYGLDRLLAEQAEKSCFDTDYIAAFNTRLDEILQHGRQEYEADKERLEKYGASFECALLNRVEKHRGNYYGITDNAEMLSNFKFRVTQILFKCLNRRSQKKSYNWDEFNDLLKDFPLARPKIYVSIYGDR